MSGGTQMLLLLAAFVIQAACQQKPRVAVSPDLPLDQIFSGDSIYLSCDGSGSGNAVKWYWNNKEHTMTNKTWKIAAASQKDSGLYQCESNSQKSDPVEINVLGYLPSASLTILTGQPVTEVNVSVVLQLKNEDGLNRWRCWVYRGDQTKKIILNLNGDEDTFDFHANGYTAHESIFWCSDESKQHRSNQVIVRTSGKLLSLQMYPLPAIEGEALTLRCLPLGTNQISHTTFYKDNKLIHDGTSPTHKIAHVSPSERGNYKCKSTFTYRGRTYGPPYMEESDNQEVLIHTRPAEASLSENIAMSCSCSDCPSEGSYRWYHRSSDDQPWKLVSSGKGSMMPAEGGTYACRAVWNNGRSLLSNVYAYQSPLNSIILFAIIGLLILGLAVIALAFYLRSKRRAKEPIYEDVKHASGKNEYEMLRKPHGSKGDGEYDTLHPEAEGSKSAERKAGEYQALKKEEMQDGVYHTVQMHEATGGEGGYAALKKEDMKGAEYQTLNKEGAAGGEGGYAALKKEEMKGGEYQTLNKEGAGGGQEAPGKSEKDYETVEEKKETAVTTA